MRTNCKNVIAAFKSGKSCNKAESIHTNGESIGSYHTCLLLPDRGKPKAERNPQTKGVLTMKLCTCERCKSAVEEEHTVEVEICGDIFILCQSCHKSLLRWLKPE